MLLEDPSGVSEVTTTVGETIELGLRDLPGAGYLWTVETTGPLRLAEPDAPTKDEILERAVGGETRRLWRVTATGTGAGTIHGRRGQPWDHAQTDLTFTINVTVADA
jgi:predicted secreted protein